MPDADQQTSIYEEMRSRRSRSELLNGLAVEQGVPVHEAAQRTAEDDEPEIEMQPAFDESEIESSVAVSEPVLHDAPAAEDGIVDELESDEPEAVAEVAETPEVAEKPENEVSEMMPQASDEEVSEDGVDALEESALEQVSDENEQETPLPASEELELPAAEQADVISNEAAPSETLPAAPDESEEVAEGDASVVEEARSAAEPENESEAVAQDVESGDEPLLGEDPSDIIDAEVNRVAEELVDRIGPVVDIQNLPKTQPSRVLSKTVKAESKEPSASKENSTPPAAEAPSEEDFPQFVDSISGDMPPDETSGSERQVEDAKPKKKKKVSLLDSYFKGL